MVKRFVILLCFFSFVIPIKAAKNHAELQINENLLKSTKKKSFKKHNKTIVFLWREEKYNKKYKTTFSEICINQSYCKTITDPERAVIGYIATFIGSDCNWDDECNADRSNLKCKVLTALNLGYQCSDSHLGFLKKWFKGDYKALKRLEDCSTTPYTATIQNTFDKIQIIHKNNDFFVIVNASSINSREEISRNWKEINHFVLLNKNQVKFLSKKTIYSKKSKL
ncbi:hypothetical protein [Flavobacterium cheonanense]|uniref:hypothetical protein n=1 Tax=Flavobacterium cheonanense TaxID=706183 RepID=UPI0031D29E9E